MYFGEMFLYSFFANFSRLSLTAHERLAFHPSDLQVNWESDLYATQLWSRKQRDSVHFFMLLRSAS
jgi:hypothetical protein